MKLIISTHIIALLLTSMIYAQENNYGKRNGYDWVGFYESATLLYSKVEWSNKQEWIDVDARNRKLCYLIGIFDLSTEMPNVHYVKYKDNKGKDQYIDFGNPYPYLFGTTPDQIMKALDKFYSDYRNMNVKILEAIHICQMEIKGESQEDIDWQTRYYRADENGRQRLINEKVSKIK